MMFRKVAVVLLSALNFFVGETFGASSFLLCDRRYSLVPGQTLTIRSPLWPFRYLPNTACRYHIEAPYDTQIQVTCNINVPYLSSDGSCSSGQFYISENGNLNITGSQPTCGATTVSRTSIANTLTLGYTTNDRYNKGRFRCQLTTVCDCGWGLNSRIVGGTEAAINEFPSTAGLIATEAGVLFCGATIVSHRYVSTAAHCLFITLPSQTSVLVGDHNVDIGQDSQYAALYAVLRFIPHPDYSQVTNVNDIGLVETGLPMTWSRGVAPVCLPFLDPNDDFSGVDVTATGWGTTEFGGRRSPYLEKVDLTVLSNGDPQCTATYPNIVDSQMCTYEEGKDFCQYDSGGPLYYSGLTGSRKFLVAQVSLGEGCGGSAPSLNTRMTEFMDWIETITGPLCHRKIE